MATENENFIISTQIDTFNIDEAGTFSGSKKITLNTKDTYVPKNIEVNVGANVNVTAASLANTETSGQTYTENTADATIIPAGGALYINKGWINNTKITLGHMIPDDTGYTNAGVAHIRNGFEAYDTEGNKLIGTMANTTLSSSGGAMSGTLSVTGGTIDVTPKITGTGVSASQGQTYGVTSTKPSGTDGTSYLTFDPDATGGNVSNSGSITVTRAKVETSGIPGYYDGTTTEFSSDTKSFTGSATTSTSIKAGSNYYMPIVTIAGTGGGVTKSSGSGSVTGTKPNVTVAYSGKFTELGTSGVGKNYGIIEGTPETGTDGTNYLSIVTTATPDAAQTWSGTATIDYTRAEIKSNANKAGAIKVTTSTSLLTSTTGSLTHEISGSVQATVSGAKTYSIPIVSVTHYGGEVTATASGSTGTRATATVTNNILGKTSTGDTIDVGNYGFEAGTWTLSEMSGANAGNGYITIYPSYSGNSPTCVCKANAHVNAVTYSNNAGAVAAHSGETALEADNATNSKTVTLSSTQVGYTSGKRSWRIHVVEPKGTGGIVTVAATASITPVGEEGGSTAPEVSIDYSGWLNDHDDTYGIVYEEPTGFHDGDNYTLLSVSNTNTDGSIVGSISGHYDRTAVKADDIYQGAVNMSTSTELLAAASNQPISGTFTTGSIGANVTGQKDIYIPVAQYSITGGDLTQDSFTVSTATGNKDMTPDMSFSKGTGNGSGSSITSSTYGIGTTKPSGDWVSIDPNVSDGSNTSGTHSITFSGSASVTRAAVTASMTRGITTDASWMLNSKTSNLSGSGTWSYTLKSGTTKYITVSTATPSVVEHTVVDPTATGSENASFKIQGTPQTLPAGVNILTSEPVDFDTYSGGYIIIEPNVTTTAGSSSAKSKVSITKGITSAKDVESAIDAQNVSVTVNTASDKCYIKVYKVEPNGYTIS